MDINDFVHAITRLDAVIEQREAALAKLNPDTDSYAEITEYDEARADHNERVVEAAYEVAAIVRNHGKG